MMHHVLVMGSFVPTAEVVKLCSVSIYGSSSKCSFDANEYVRLSKIHHELLSITTTGKIVMMAGVPNLVVTIFISFLIINKNWRNCAV